MDTLENLPKST